jgi:ammonia channel protein AmtB
MIVFFHSTEGIFFTDIHKLVNETSVAGIIMIFGANILGALVVIGWTALFTFPFYLIIKRCCLRVNKVDEIIGLDVT